MLALWKPFKSLANFDYNLFNWDTFDPQNFRPAIDIVEQEDHFLIEADLPGMTEKDIEIKIHDGKLMLSGKRKKTTEKKYYSERYSGSFSRQFTIDPYVNVENIKATFKNGVLSITLPKKEEVKPKLISISS